MRCDVALSRPASSRFGFSLVLAGCGAGVGSYVAAALVVAPGADLVRHVGWFLVAFAFYLLAVAMVLVAERRQMDGGTHRADLALIFGVAILFRGALLATHPSLSDDVFRYVWDGRILNAGIHPYLYAPSAPELAPFRDFLWEAVNHKPMRSPYPPLAEALFAGVYRLAPDSLTAMQVAAVAFDLAVAVLLLPMLARWGLDPRRVVIYAWNPLLLVQFAHSAHFDGAMVLSLLGAIYLLALQKRLASGLMLGVSAMIKLVPALAVPLFAPLWGVSGLMGAAAMVAASVLPFVGSGLGFGGLMAEAGEARFNDSINYLLVKLLGVVAAGPEMPVRIAASATLLGASLLMSWALWRDAAGWKGLLLSVYRLLGLFLLLNAVVEPWYLTWMVPFLCFSLDSTRRGFPRLDPALGWLLLSGSVVLTDLTYLPSAGSSTWIWVRLAEYLPLYGLLALWGWRRRARLLPRRHEGPRLPVESVRAVSNVVESEASKVAQERGPERPLAGRRLEPGHIYFDLDHPEQGPFVATGDEEVPPGANIVAREEVDDEAWESLVAEGWGESKPGAGDRSYDQGAFGQEDDPRSDVINAAPLGVGEGLTPRESEEEMPRD